MTEVIDISVQQHKSHRSVNHEIVLKVKLQESFERNIDWQIKIIDAIKSVLGDEQKTDVVVREIRNVVADPKSFLFVYRNESLPKNVCPDIELEEIVEKLDLDELNTFVKPAIIVESVKEELIGNCKKQDVQSRITVTPSKNFPPVPRNQVDRVNATVGRLLTFRVPSDTFYDPEDENDLKLTLLSLERTKLDPTHWLQFDSKNREFYGIPKPSDVGQKEYLLVAEDRGGLTATDALVVVVTAEKKDYSVLFDFVLGISLSQFNRSDIQRRFVERVSNIFGDPNTENILIRAIRRLPQTHNVLVSW